MKLKYNQLDAFIKAYQNISKSNLPVRTAYKMAKLNAEIAQEYQFYSDEFKKIIANYADVNEDGSYKASEDGTSISIKPDCIEECKIKISELNHFEYEISDYEFTLNDVDGIMLSPDDMNGLMPFIKEE